MRKLTLYIMAVMLSFCSAVYAQNDNAKIYSVTIDEIITNSTASIIKNAIDTASADNGSLLLIELNTPGGILEATRTAVQHILSSPVPVTVYVTPSGARAASAGIFIALAANFTVMEEGTNIGAAHPVVGDGSNLEGDMRQKVENDTIAFIRSIAEKRGRDVQIAEKMVKDSASYTASEALKLKIIDAVATDKEGIKTLIKKKFNISGDITIVPIEPSFMQSVSKFLSNPDIIVALLFLGIIMLGLEFKMPGSFVFAGIGGICFILFAIGANIIPINYLAFFLILCGFALLIAEIFVTSFGLLTIGGIVSLLFGLRMLFDRSETTGVSVSIWFTAFITGITAIIALSIGRLVVKDLKRKPASGMDTFIDKHAKVLDWENGFGHIAIYGEIWNSESSQELKAGDDVIIESYKGMVIKVRKAI